MKFKKIGLILSTLLLVGGMSGCMNKSGEKEILRYLEDKYNEEFIVEEFYKSSKLEYEYGADKIIVHPSSNEEILFVAGEVNNSNGGYYDNYVLVKLAKELNEVFKNIILTEINAESDFTVRIYAPDNMYDETMLNMNVFDFVDQYKDDMDLGIKIAILVDSEEDVDRMLEGILNIHKEIKKYNAESNHVSVGFVKDLSKVEKYIQGSNATNIPWLKLNEEIIVGELSINESCNIENVEELKRFYRSLGE